MLGATIPVVVEFTAGLCPPCVVAQQVGFGSRLPVERMVEELNAA